MNVTTLTQAKKWSDIYKACKNSTDVIDPTIWLLTYCRLPKIHSIQPWQQYTTSAQLKDLSTTQIITEAICDEGLSEAATKT